MLSKNYTGCSVFIYDQHGKIISRTTVQEFDRKYMTITLRGNVEFPQDEEYLTILIVVDDGVHEYQGVIHKTTFEMNMFKISLFKGQSRESRKAKRHNVNAKGIVSSLIINKTRAKMLNPLPVRVVNISTSGALLEARSNSFSPHACFVLELSVDGNKTELLGCIEWIRAINEETENYGCQFLAK